MQIVVFDLTLHLNLACIANTEVTEEQFLNSNLMYYSALVEYFTKLEVTSGKFLSSIIFSFCHLVQATMT